MDTFLTPFVAETEKLYRDGFYWKDKLGGEHHSRVKFTLFIADAVARAALCNLKQFNGVCGCLHCEHPGKRVEKVKGGKRQLEVDDGSPEEPLLKKKKSTELLDKSK